MTIAAAKGTNTGISNLRLDLPLHINKLDTPVNNAIKSVVMAQSPLDQGYALRNLDAISGGRSQTLELLSNAAAGSDSGKLTNGLHSKISERVEVLESRGDSVAVLRDYESRSIVLRYGFVPAAPIGGTRAMRHTKSEIYNMDTGRQISAAQNVRSASKKPSMQVPVLQRDLAGIRFLYRPVAGSLNIKDKVGEGQGYFGASRGKTRLHAGIDINAQKGTEIISPADEKIISVIKRNVSSDLGAISAKKGQGGGTVIVIDHGNGVTTHYLHLKYDSVRVKVGQKIRAGVIIAEVGRTGNTPQAGDTHLHFEIKLRGDLVNPESYLPKTK